MKDFAHITELVDISMRSTADAKNIVITPKATETTDKTFTTPNSAASDTIVARTSTDQGADRLKNKDLEDSSVVIVDATDTTKKIKFDAAGTTGTSTTLLSSQTTNKTLTLPDITDTVVTKTSTDIFQNKTTVHGASGNSITGLVDASIASGAAINANKIAGGSVTNAQFNELADVGVDAAGNIVTTDASQNISNKTLAATTILKSGFKLEEAGGADQLVFQVQGQTGGANINIQDLGGVSQDIVLSARAATLTNKTIDGSLNTISNLALTTQVTGVLPGANGGTGVNNSGKTITLGGNLETSGAFASTLTVTGVTAVTLPTSGTLATLAGAEALSSKTLASPDVTTHIRVLNQGQVKLREGIGGGTNEVSIQAPATLAGDYTLTLPVDDGNANQVLTTDGAGVLSWGTAAATPGTAGNVFSDGASLQTIAFAANANKVFGVNSAATSEEAKSILVGTSGTDFAVAHAAGSITLNLPDASSANRGAVTTGTQTIAGAKTMLADLVVGTGTPTGSRTLTVLSDGANRAYMKLQSGTNIVNISQGSSTDFETSQNAAINFVMNGTTKLTLNNSATNGVSIRGASDASNASTGYVGEYVVVNNASVNNFPASNVWGGDHSIALTAGDWDVTLVIEVGANAAGGFAYCDACIGTATGNDATGRIDGDNHAQFAVTTALAGLETMLIIPNYRILTSSSTTRYVKIRGGYSSGTPIYRYRMSARRIR